jgi:hypothetical protein
LFPIVLKQHNLQTIDHISCCQGLCRSQQKVLSIPYPRTPFTSQTLCDGHKLPHTVRMHPQTCPVAFWSVSQFLLTPISRTVLSVCYLSHNLTLHSLTYTLNHLIVIFELYLLFLTASNLTYHHHSYYTSLCDGTTLFCHL